MATATEYASPPGFSRSSSLSANRSPDTASPIFPERAIRPLPRSRLKSKLSPEQASSIVYPPDPPPISPALNLGGQEIASTAASKGRMTNGDLTHGNYAHHHSQQHQEAASHGQCTCGGEGDSGDDEVEFDHPDYRYPAAAGEAQDKVLDKVHRRLMEATRALSGKAAHAGSAASSADGYESFEHTSNKKKRKIPLSTQSSLHQSQLSAEMASMGISGNMDGATDGGGVMTQGYTPPSQGTGISGAGRGRYGRQSGRGDLAVRRPLGSSSMNSVNHAFTSRLPGAKGVNDVNGTDSGVENTGGIISQAIKSAAEQGPLTPHKAGQENSSLLHSAANAPASASTANNKTQFTFTMESESATKLVDQQAAVAAAAYSTPTPNQRSAPGRPTNNTGTQTTPSMQAPPRGQQRVAPMQPSPNNANHIQPQRQAKQQQPPKPRRRPSKEYALAARQRRLQQEYTNYHHRPTKDNMWICEFCEYEDIFGYPPVQLIREYERKDRAERKKQAEKRRLLEKAKAKNRKNKKGSKKGGNNNAGAHAAKNQGQYANDLANQPYDPALDPQDDEFYDDDEFGDEYDAVNPDDPGYEDQYYHPQHAGIAAPPQAPIRAPTHTATAGAGAGGGGGGGRNG